MRGAIVFQKGLVLVVRGGGGGVPLIHVGLVV